MTTSVLLAIDGAPTFVFGQESPASDYLSALRSLAILLTHIATKSAPQHAEAWAEVVRDEAARRSTEHRGPRWGIRPPDEPQARGEALAEAHSLLSEASLGTAAESMSHWIAYAPSTQVGPAGWIKNRMSKSSLVADLVEQALSPRQCTSRQLVMATGEIGLPDSAIPQVIPLDVYHRTLGPVIGAGPDVGRRFASLCLAKLNGPGRTWSRAAEVLGYSSETGKRTPKAVTHKVTCTVPELSPLLTSIRDELIGGPDYRRLEAVVRGLAAATDSWFQDWASGQRPPKRPMTLPYALTWMWTYVALGDLDSSPGWDMQPTRQQKAGYRAFAGRLSRQAQSQLVTIANEPITAGHCSRPRKSS